MGNYSWLTVAVPVEQSGRPGYWKRYAQANEDLHKAFRETCGKDEWVINGQTFNEAVASRLGLKSDGTDWQGHVFELDGTSYVHIYGSHYTLQYRCSPPDMWLLCFDEEEKLVEPIHDDVACVLYTAKLSDAKKRLRERLDKYTSLFSEEAMSYADWLLTWLGDCPDGSLLTCDFADYAWYRPIEELERWTVVADLIESLESALKNPSSISDRPLDESVSCDASMTVAAAEESGTGSVLDDDFEW